jgi:hypothetical protein
MTVAVALWATQALGSKTALFPRDMLPPVLIFARSAEARPSYAKKFAKASPAICIISKTMLPAT